MVDYSKWDRLELSDDSDIEVHPNVDKRSFIRAKQRQIHEARQRRKQQIADLKSQLQINTELLNRISMFQSRIETNPGGAKTPEEQTFKTMIELASRGDDTPPPVSHLKSGPGYTYSQMMAQLIDQVKKEVDAQNPSDRWNGFAGVFKSHFDKLVKVQAEAVTELARLQKEEASKITSESYHDGFDVGYVNTPKPAPPPPKTTEKKKPTTATSVEQINPHATKMQFSDSSGAEADVDDDDEVDRIKPSATGLEFAKIRLGDYRRCLEFISQHPEVVAEKEENGLLIEAFNSQIAGKAVFARQCVHQALLLQYCRQLGPDGVGLFFKRITTKNHQAQQVFIKDVTETYEKLRTRAAELEAERIAGKDSEGAGVETIQLQAVEPGTSINIQVPPAGTGDPEIERYREIFESFPPGLQRALQTGELEEVNKVLAKMTVEEAEEVVARLGEGGMLSLQSGIYDATTEEGRQQIQELEAAAKERAEHGEEEEEGVQGLRIEEEDESLPVEGQQFEEKGKGKGKA